MGVVEGRVVAFCSLWIVVNDVGEVGTVDGVDDDNITGEGVEGRVVGDVTDGSGPHLMRTLSAR